MAHALTVKQLNKTVFRELQCNAGPAGQLIARGYPKHEFSIMQVIASIASVASVYSILP